AAEPRNGRAWRVLGSAYQQLKDFDKAFSANKTALEVDPAVPTPAYAIGVVYALKKDKDQAFSLLERAKATRKIDMTQIQTDSNLAFLKDDRRFDALLPPPEDFANPFVEPVKILR